jgi:lipoate---protein ligase
MRSVKETPDPPGIALLDLQFSSPAENLACDEALLDQCETSEAGGFLRFWESKTHFVVLGYSKRLEEEIFGDKCAELGLPILRRCSGGGTVLQGPGCLNYALVLPIESALELETITGANRYIMERNRSAVERIVHSSIAVQGHTDLTTAGRKFSGNAQRRKKRSLLFHGGLLLDFDLNLISRTLRLPNQQPNYRASRTHADFLVNLPIARAELKKSLIDQWRAIHKTDPVTEQAVMTLCTHLSQSKYTQPAWNVRF